MMFRLAALIYFLLFSTLVFAQQDSAFRIVGRIPGTNERGLYRIQVGAFRLNSNAERAYERLRAVSLDPVYERYYDFTRVIVTGINAREITVYLDKIRNAGFTEVIIRVDTAVPAAVRPSAVRPIAELPVSSAVIPSATLREITSRTIRIGETRNLAELTEGKTVTSWTSSTPSSAAVDANGTITGLAIGNAFIAINDREYISIAVVPQEEFFVVPEYMASLLPPESKTGDTSASHLTEYRTEPTFRLAYRFNNKGENRGASGGNGGIDILGRGADYEWLWTTYHQGGWFYDLNGIMREMINGYQSGSNGVALTVQPEFVYDNGIPYLQLRHLLHNTNNFAVTGQRFGASADVMIHNNDNASLEYTQYGAYMTDYPDNPSLELMFVCLFGNGITPVDTLWLGTYNEGMHLERIYDDRRINVHNADSAIGFSYQNISLAPGEIKEFIVRFTLARYED